MSFIHGYFGTWCAQNSFNSISYWMKVGLVHLMAQKCDQTDYNLLVASGVPVRWPYTPADPQCTLFKRYLLICITKYTFGNTCSLLKGMRDLRSLVWIVVEFADQLLKTAHTNSFPITFPAWKNPLCPI